MTGAGGLEGAYRRLLRWSYPPLYLRRHEEEILGVLMAAAQPGQRRPGARESLDLLWSALRIRIRMILRGADSRPWAAALAQAGVLIPLLMVLLKLTLFLDRGVLYGFRPPADILFGRFLPPGGIAWHSRLILVRGAGHGGYFHFPYSVVVMVHVTAALMAGPVPELVLAGLVCLGWRRTAAVFAALVPLAYLGLSLAIRDVRFVGPRIDVTVYAFGLEALVLLAAPDSPRGWRALRWRPSALLAVATVAAGVGLNGGFWPQSYGPPFVPFRWRNGPWGCCQEVNVPHGFAGLADRLFGIGPGGWGGWLAYQGTLVAIVAAALTIMLVSSPANRRVLFLLLVPFALGGVVYLFVLISREPLGAIGAALTALPPLLLMTAVALPLMRRRRAGPDIPSGPIPT